MNKYAEITDGVVGHVTETMGVPPEGTVLVPGEVMPGWLHLNGGVFVPPPTEQAALDKQAAQAVLDASDKTILRCYESGVRVPEAWSVYRFQLRDIVSGKALGPLPTRPPFPAGT